VASALAESLKNRLFRAENHPFRALEEAVGAYIRPDSWMLEAGCGRSSALIARFGGKIAGAVGLDLSDLPRARTNGSVHYIQNDLAHIGLRAESIDLVVSRSVVEHLPDPAAAYREVVRVLKPGGHFVFLTPNLWDYASLISKAIPNRYHAAIVARTEGRSEEDTFPVHYRSNTVRDIRRLAARSGLELVSAEYLGQYPCYLKFNAVLFLIGSAYEKLIEKVTPLRFLRGWLLVDLTKPKREAAPCAESPVS